MRRTTLILVAAVVLLYLCTECYCGKDFYGILGVPRDANTKQIRKAFRELSLKWHPDKNPGDEAAKNKYQEINNAYEVLSDDEKRRVYDQFGEEGLQPGAQRQRSPFDMFNPFHQHGTGAENMQRGSNIELPLFVSLEDLYLGKELKIANRKQILCQKCRGTGAKNADDIQKCTECGGRGVKITTRQLGPGFVQQMQQTCPVCDGKGTIAKSKCPHCTGKKVEIGENTIMVVIEKGMPDRHRLVFEQEADQAPNTVPGDLILTLITAPHARFQRVGNDLRTQFRITLLQALVGFEATIEHLDGHKVQIVRSDVTIHGHVERITGQGMPHHEFPSFTGDLFVEFVVLFPAHLTDAQKDGFRKLLKE